ncbi:HNH endonuclease [Neptunomonas japonica]|uniref:HNH endonuclease n=1 Tax=Neptunomonas japonica TaxID=417574 RepID=UPI00041ABC43|nr:HNH endonuclease [Neptunomonas japonica]
MGYPFDCNPFDTHLHSLQRVLLLKRTVANSVDLLKNSLARPLLVAELKQLSDIEAKLIKKLHLEPRSFDFFGTGFDLEWQAFLKEFPQPPEPSLCLHNLSEPRSKYHSNGSLHIVVQCLECGNSLKTLKRSDYPNWKQCSEFDYELRFKDPIAKEYRYWREIKSEHYQMLMEKYPKFTPTGQAVLELIKDQHKHAKEKLLQDFPEPIHRDNCDHSSTDVTIRLLSSGKQVVQQCLSCGHHLKAISKNKTEDIGCLPLFDEEIEKLREPELALWQSRVRSLDKYWGGLYRNACNENSQPVRTFEQYYSSEEWSRTRQRIFYRDDCICQACRSKAEIVHHIVYDRLGRENDLDLISLCSDCHDQLHTMQNAVSKALYNIAYRLTPNDIRRQIWLKPDD